MEGTDQSFFYSARSVGLNPVVISLAEQPHLDWRGRAMYIRAKMERRRTELYAMDLLWMLTKTKYEMSSPRPSRIEAGHKEADPRTYADIREELRKKTQELINGSV